MWSARLFEQSDAHSQVLTEPRQESLAQQALAWVTLVEDWLRAAQRSAAMYLIVKTALPRGPYHYVKAGATGVVPSCGIRT